MGHTLARMTGMGGMGWVSGLWRREWRGDLVGQLDSWSMVFSFLSRGWH